jgi:predicted transcriptional regulator
MKYRSKTDIIGHILESVNSATVVGDGDNNNNGLTISKIMYTAFLSYPQLKEYLSLLLEKGLIEEYQNELEEKEVEEKRKQQPSYYYRITDKGRQFLQIYRDLSEMIMIAHR